MKLAFVGPPAVGKDAASNYIEEKYKMVHISSGDIIRRYVTENNLGGLDRKNLQIVANKLRSEKGGDVLIRIAMENHKDDIILSGLRAIDEVESFKKFGGLVIAIDAPLQKRYGMAKLRGRIDDDSTIEDFIKLEDEERMSTDRNGQNVDAVVSMADIKITNDGDLNDLFKKCDELMRLPRTA
jgi:dephospho-CoA kinase